MLQPTVHILLATYNGSRFLAEQLDSLARQSHTQWTLTVSDDGSTDDTLAIVKRFAQRIPHQVTVLLGPCQGSSTKNFFHLIQQVPTENSQDLFAYCDQDDVWLPDKLASAVAFFTQCDNTEAANLYCGCTKITNEALEPIGISDIPQALTFGNALAQNMASGNTMVFTSRLLEVLKHIKPEHSVWHDWSTYQAALACGGVVHFDAQAHVLYRQHGSNVVGIKNGLLNRLKRLFVNLHGRYSRRGDLVEKAMLDISPFMTEDAKRIFKAYRDARHARTGLDRIRYAREAGIYRQGWSEQLAFVIALLMGKV